MVSELSVIETVAAPPPVELVVPEALDVAVASAEVAVVFPLAVVVDVATPPPAPPLPSEPPPQPAEKTNIADANPNAESAILMSLS